jgi:hypothetical protein
MGQVQVAAVAGFKPPTKVTSSKSSASALLSSGNGEVTGGGQDRYDLGLGAD